jgi:hypothetical protein
LPCLLSQSKSLRWDGIVPELSHSPPPSLAVSPLAFRRRTK